MLTAREIVDYLANPPGDDTELQRALGELLVQFPSFQAARLLSTVCLVAHDGPGESTRRSLHETALMLPSAVSIYSALHPEVSKAPVEAAPAPFHPEVESDSIPVEEAPEDSGGEGQTVDDLHSEVEVTVGEPVEIAVGIPLEASPSEVPALHEVELEVEEGLGLAAEGQMAGDAIQEEVSNATVEPFDLTNAEVFPSLGEQEVSDEFTLPEVTTEQESAEKREPIQVPEKEVKEPAPAVSGEIDLRGVLDRSLGQEGRLGATLCTLEAGKEELENSDFEFVTTTLNPYYKPSHDPLARQRRLIDSFLDDLDAMQAALHAKLQEYEAGEVRDEDFVDLNAWASAEMPDVHSERLAKLLEDQGDIPGAIAMYRGLMSEKSEKSAYFASQIARLEGLGKDEGASV